MENLPPPNSPAPEEASMLDFDEYRDPATGGEIFIPVGDDAPDGYQLVTGAEPTSAGSAGKDAPPAAGNVSPPTTSQALSPAQSRWAYRQRQPASRPGSPPPTHGQAHTTAGTSGSGGLGSSSLPPQAGHSPRGRQYTRPITVGATWPTITPRAKWDYRHHPAIEGATTNLDGLWLDIDSLPRTASRHGHPMSPRPGVSAPTYNFDPTGMTQDEILRRIEKIDLKAVIGALAARDTEYTPRRAEQAALTIRATAREVVRSRGVIQAIKERFEKRNRATGSGRRSH